jgi:serine/threonine-protein kinase HipA
MDVQTLLKASERKLSPAYDLTPTPAISQDQRNLSMICGDEGRFANAKNILSQHARFLLDKSAAEQIVSSMTREVSDNWYSVCRSSGVSERDAAAIESAFVYPGFNRALPETDL